MYLYTKRGTYHKGNGLKSGDVVYGVDDGTLAVLTLADGVSSCAYGDIGARLITSMAIEYGIIFSFFSLILRAFYTICISCSFYVFALYYVICSFFMFFVFSLCILFFLHISASLFVHVSISPGIHISQ